MAHLKWKTPAYWSPRRGGECGPPEVEDAGILVVEALVVGHDLGEEVLVECQVRDGGQQPTVA